MDLNARQVTSKRHINYTRINLIIYLEKKATEKDTKSIAARETRFP